MKERATEEEGGEREERGKREGEGKEVKKRVREGEEEGGREREEERREKRGGKERGNRGRRVSLIPRGVKSKQGMVSRLPRFPQILA